MHDEGPVLEAERNFFAALINRRTEDLDRLLAADFTLIDLAGNLTPKAMLLEAVGSGHLQFFSIEPVEASVRFYGATAVIIGRTQMEGRFGDAPFRMASRYMHVYVEDQGSYTFVAAQGTPISG
jgi:hypothetical protein